MNQAMKQPPGWMTVAEFADWDPGDTFGARWQLIDGRPVAMAPASRTHGVIQGTLGFLIRQHLDKTASSCSLVVTPGIIPLVQSDSNFRIPDLCVTSSPPSTGLEVTDPILIAEILSPRNITETRANIWAYTTIPSLQEIIVVHSTRIEIEVLRREDTGWPPNSTVFGAGGTITLASIGLSVEVNTLYQKTSLEA